MSFELPCADPQPISSGLFRTDVFNRTPWLKVLTRPSDGQHAYFVRNWNEAYALHGRPSFEDVNPAYIRSLIIGDCSASVSPYRRILRVPRSHYLSLAAAQTARTVPYDPFACGGASMAEVDLHAYLRHHLLDTVSKYVTSSSCNIGCEHSSGIDSNSIVGALIHGISIAPKRIHTWTDPRNGEGALLPRFRSYLNLIPDQCYELPYDHPIDNTSLNAELKLSIYGAPPQLCASVHAASTFQRAGCSIVFSGFGGDQGISHNGVNLAFDLTRRLRLNELYQWSGNYGQFIKRVRGSLFGLLLPSLARKKVHGRVPATPGTHLLLKHLTPSGFSYLKAYKCPPHPWEYDEYLPTHTSIRRRLLADWVAVRAEEEMRMAAYFGFEVVHPFLNEHLIATILNQDPAVFTQSPSCGRLLARAAFAPFLHPMLASDPTKNRLPFDSIDPSQLNFRTHLVAQVSALLSESRHWHSLVSQYWNSNALFESLWQLVSETSTETTTLLSCLDSLGMVCSLSAWWSAMERG